MYMYMHNVQKYGVQILCTYRETDTDTQNHEQKKPGQCSYMHATAVKTATSAIPLFQLTVKAY